MRPVCCARVGGAPAPAPAWGRQVVERAREGARSTAGRGRGWVRRVAAMAMAMAMAMRPLGAGSLGGG